MHAAQGSQQASPFRGLLHWHMGCSVSLHFLSAQIGSLFEGQVEKSSKLNTNGNKRKLGKGGEKMDLPLLANSELPPGCTDNACYVQCVFSRSPFEHPSLFLEIHRKSDLNLH